MGSKIWNLVQIRCGATVGIGCTLGKNVFIDRDVSIGNRVKIQNNVSVYSGVCIADDVFVGPSAVFTNDLRPRATADDWQIVPTDVGRGASIGANATVVCGTRIGEHAMVAAGAVVTRPVAPYELVAGNPARHLGWVCACGDVITHDVTRPATLRCLRCRERDDAEGPGHDSAGKRIPMACLQFGGDEERAVVAVLRSGRLAQGPKVAELEEVFAALHGTRHAVAVNSGTTALIASLEALGIGPGDEVITSPLSFAATVNAIVAVGARARFADIRDDFTLDPDALAGLITDRTAVLLPVHLYGLPADMAPIRSLADRHGLAVVEDAAQAIGATYDGRPVGSFGMGAFSLYATKNVTCGEGGMVTTDDGDLARRLKILRNQGMTAAYEFLLPGHNYRLTDLQAALALPQLRRLNRIRAARTANAEMLSKGLSDLSVLVLPHVPAGRTHVWHQFTVRVTDQAPVDRDTFRARLDRVGIETGCYYPRLIPGYPCYQAHPLVAPDPTPNAARIAQQVVSLPVHPGIGPSEVGRIVDAVRAVVEG